MDSAGRTPADRPGSCLLRVARTLVVRPGSSLSPPAPLPLRLLLLLFSLAWLRSPRPRQTLVATFDDAQLLPDNARALRTCSPPFPTAHPPAALHTPPADSLAASTQAQEVRVATEHPFLAAAGKHELSSEQLSTWLTQDRCYALHGCTSVRPVLLPSALTSESHATCRPKVHRCVGRPPHPPTALTQLPHSAASLISALPLSSPAHQSASQSTLALLSYAMSNIHREVGFFDSLSPRFGLDLARRPGAQQAGSLQGGLMRVETKAYVDLLIATGAEANRNGGGMEEGLVLLWTMEKVHSRPALKLQSVLRRRAELTALRIQLYNQAWLFAATHSATPSATDEKTSAALTELIDNWTNAEFAEFVAKCEEAVEKLQLEEGTPEWDRAEEVRSQSLFAAVPPLRGTIDKLRSSAQIFKYTLYLEQRFWPGM